MSSSVMNEFSQHSRVFSSYFDEFSEGISFELPTHLTNWPSTDEHAILWSSSRESERRTFPLLSPICPAPPPRPSPPWAAGDDEDAGASLIHSPVPGLALWPGCGVGDGRGQTPWVAAAGGPWGGACSPQGWGKSAGAEGDPGCQDGCRHPGSWIHCCPPLSCYGSMVGKELSGEYLSGCCMHR